jgi:hypothetical protein
MSFGSDEARAILESMPYDPSSKKVRCQLIHDFLRVIDVDRKFAQATLQLRDEKYNTIVSVDKICKLNDATIRAILKNLEEYQRLKLTMGDRLFTDPKSIRLLLTINRLVTSQFAGRRRTRRLKLKRL